MRFPLLTVLSLNLCYHVKESYQCFFLKLIRENKDDASLQIKVF